ncbi:unnamed protein product [Euphydryas editha]|uniref:Reverse transcriptase domain-containing protein n=1 Tax=Euphydryas editha TaxID=104508 RepID=A0AAU9U6Q6_EUPED|nr:unnamed protein product [Euphydryas editha]
MLDLALVSASLGRVNVQRAMDVIILPDEYHPPFEIPIERKFPSGDVSWVSASTEWDFRNANFHALYNCFLNVNWDSIFNIKDPDTAVAEFYSIVNSYIDSCVPSKRRVAVLSRYCYPDWYMPLTKRYIKYKAHFHRLYKKTLCSKYRIKFSYYRAIVKLSIKSDFRIYQRRIESDVRRDPSTFWGYIAAKRKAKKIKAIINNGVTVPNDKCAQMFADFFSSVYTQHPPDLDPQNAMSFSGSSSSRIHIGDLTLDDVNQAFGRLKAKRSPGPDGIPPYIIKDCRSVFSQPLLFIFNLCLKNSRYPDIWKVSRVVPVPKNDSGSEVNDFRPVAVLSVFAKLFETVLHRVISVQVENQLSDAQHGFRASRSTTSNMLTFYTYAEYAMDGGSQVDAAYFDYRKAFDTVDNDLLLRKFATAGFTPSLLQFFSCYLHNRRQYAQFNGYLSRPYYTFSGISQGSNLGPLLFLIFVNDLPDTVGTARCLLFADDLKLFLAVDSPSDCELLQQDIINVTEWSTRNKLVFNKSKCSVMSFTRAQHPIVYYYRLDDSTLDRKTSIKDLGILMRPDLSFTDHICNVATKAYKSLGFILRQSSDLESVAVMKILYNSFVRSILENNAVIWSPHEAKYKNMLEKLQKKFLRWLYFKRYGYFVGYPFVYPSLFLQGMLGYDSLELRRDVFLMEYFYKLITGKISNPSVLSLIPLSIPKYNHVRRHTLFAVRGCSLRLMRESPLIRALTLLNGVLAWDPTLDLFFSTPAVFRRTAKRFAETRDVISI